MRQQTKTNLKLGFGSLIKNDAAIEAAKTIPGYVPVIIGLIAAFIPVIPLMVSTSKSYGSQFLKSNTYNLDRYNTAVMMEVKEAGYDFYLTNGELLRYKDDGVDKVRAESTVETEFTPIGEYIVSDGTISTIKYQLYYSERYDKGADFEKIKNFKDAITNTTYLKETTFVKDSDEAIAYIEARQAGLPEGGTYKPEYYRPSFTIIYRLGLYTYVLNESTNKQAATYAGDWKHYRSEKGLIDNVLDVEPSHYGANVMFEKDINGDYKLLRNGEFTADVQKNMNKIYNESFITAKNNSFLLYTLVFYGVYVLLIAFMGLMIFLLTRGKRNPMNYMSFWLSVKISAWASPAPAILALILGFLLTNFATMFFIILFGLRIMWLSMRQLRPQY